MFLNTKQAFVSALYAFQRCSVRRTHIKVCIWSAILHFRLQSFRQRSGRPVTSHARVCDCTGVQRRRTGGGGVRRIGAAGGAVAVVMRSSSCAAAAELTGQLSSTKRRNAAAPANRTLSGYNGRRRRRTAGGGAADCGRRRGGPGSGPACGGEQLLRLRVRQRRQGQRRITPNVSPPNTPHRVSPRNPPP